MLSEVVYWATAGHGKIMFEERQKVVAAVASGRSLRSVARRFDVAPRTALLWYLEATPEEPATVAAALEVLAEGWSIDATAEAARVPRWRLRQWLRRSRE